MYIYIYHRGAVYLLAIRNTDYSRKWDFVCNVLQSLNSESAPRYNLSIPVSFLDTISSKFINRDPSNLCVCIYERRAESGDGGRVVGWTDSSIGDGRGKWRELEGKDS